MSKPNRALQTARRIAAFQTALPLVEERSYHRADLLVEEERTNMYLHGSNGAAEKREPNGEVSLSPRPDGGRLFTETAAADVAEQQSHAVDPVIVRFRAALESVQTRELERLYGRLPELDDASWQVIHQFADCLVAKMLQPPLQTLRDESQHGSTHRLLESLQRLFRLSD
jgi:glutamyl-tRNA reductase